MNILTVIVKDPFVLPIRTQVIIPFFPSFVFCSSFLSFIHDVLWFVPFHAAKGCGFRFWGAIPFFSTRQGTFPLRFVAAHVLQHCAGNSWGRFRARGRAGERFRRVRCMGAVSLRGCDFFLCKHGTGNVSLVNRSRPRAAARRGERLGPVSCPDTCWERRALLHDRGRAGERFRWVRCMGAVSLHECGSVLARARERFPCVSWPPTCCSMAWGTVGDGFVPGDVLRRSFVVSLHGRSFVAWMRFLSLQARHGECFPRES